MRPRLRFGSVSGFVTPRVTANQVTFARIILMPLLAALFYGPTAARGVAIVLMGVVGVTDLLDGYLARKQGPTILGGLMDPIADKVYTAMCAFPFAHLGIIPWWVVIALFVREFVVTAFRSSFELRQRTLRTT